MEGMMPGGLSSEGYLKHAVIVGAVAAVLAAIPFVGGVLVCCFCIGVWLPAAIGVRMFCRGNPTAGLALSEAMIYGLIVAVMAAFGQAISGLIWSLAGGDVASTQMLIDFLSQIPDLPPETIEQLELAAEQAEMAGAGNAFVSFLGSLFCGGAVYSIFGVLGGVLGLKLFAPEKEIN